MGIFDGAKDVLDRAVKAMTGPEAERVEMTPKEINEYRNMITNAERYHKRKFVEAYAKRYLGYLEGELNGKSFDGSNWMNNPNSPYDASKAYRIFCNEFYVCSEVLKPNLFFRNPYAALEAEQENITEMAPKIDLDGLTPVLDEIGQPIMEEQIIATGTEAAELLENVVNTTLKSESVKIKQVAKKCTATMVALNFAVAKWGWNTEFNGESMNLQVIKDEATCEWFSPLNFLPDPEATRADLKDAKFVIFRFIKPTSEIKKSPMYKGVANLKGTSVLKFDGDKDDSRYIDDYHGELVDLDRSTLYEIWDIVKRKVVVFVDGLDYPIRDTSQEEWAKKKGDGWLWGLKGYPCTILTCGESLTGFYPTPDFRAYESLVMTKTLLVQKLTNSLLALSRSFIGNKTAFKDTDKRTQIEDVQENGIVWVDNPQGKDLKSFLQPLNDFAYSESYNEFIRIIDDNVQKLSGISDFQKGLISQARRTASEIINLQNSQNLRIDYRQDAIADWLESNVKILIELLQNNVSGTQLQKMTKDEQTTFKAWTRAIIQGKYSVSIDVGDMVKPNIEMRKKEARDAYTMFINNPLVDQVENTKAALKGMGVKDTEKRLNKAQVAMYLQNSAMPQPGAVPGSEITPTEAATGEVEPITPVEEALA